MGDIAILEPVDETDALLTRLRDLVRVRNMFGQQVPTNVVDAVLRGEVDLAGSRAEATILMTDIRGFTAVSETLEPVALVALLNRYLETMLTAIEEFGGTLDKFLGDGLLIHFNLPLPQPDHPLLAVRTALRMRERLVAFNQDQVARGEPPISIGMGINTGVVIAGNIGIEGRKTEYTVMGHEVNLASRMESATKELNADIVISNATYERVRDAVEVGAPTELTMKGQPPPFSMYPVLGSRLA